MAEPDLLLFDEPCAGLDLGGREALVALLGELARDGGRPLVMVTHHLEEIPPGFTHALLLRSGRMVAAGPIAETLTSAAVSDTFGLAVGVDTDGRRYSARDRSDLTHDGGTPDVALDRFDRFEAGSAAPRWAVPTGTRH